MIGVVAWAVETGEDLTGVPEFRTSDERPGGSAILGNGNCTYRNFVLLNYIISITITISLTIGSIILTITANTIDNYLPLENTYTRELSP
jgi:hypothetical protein